MDLDIRHQVQVWKSNGMKESRGDTERGTFSNTVSLEEVPLTCIQPLRYNWQNNAPERGVVSYLF